MSSLRAGMIGAGNMGGRMGRCVAAAGDPIVAFDVNAQTLADSGLDARDSVAALVADVDVVFLSLPDSSVIEPVMLGSDGVAAHVHSGQTVVDLSTADPQSSIRIHSELEKRGVQFLDAGISGGAAAAEKGTLTLMVGGDPEALEHVRHVMERFSKLIVHMGGPGTGHTAKVLNNFLNGLALSATAEVMLAARRSGLDLERLLEVINASSGINFATLNRFPSIIKGDYLEGGLTGKLMAKDVRLYLDHMASIGVPTFSGPGCLAAFEVANAHGYGDQISNRVVDGLGDLVGGLRLYEPTEQEASR